MLKAPVGRSVSMACSKSSVRAALGLVEAPTWKGAAGNGFAVLDLDGLALTRLWRLSFADGSLGGVPNEKRPVLLGGLASPNNCLSTSFSALASRGEGLHVAPLTGRPLAVSGAAWAGGFGDVNWNAGFCSGDTRIFFSISRMDSACAGSWSFMPSASNCCKRRIESYDKLSLFNDKPAMTASRSMAWGGASPFVLGAAAVAMASLQRRRHRVCRRARVQIIAS